MKYKKFSTHPIVAKFPGAKQIKTAKGEDVAFIDTGKVQGTVETHRGRTMFLRKRDEFNKRDAFNQKINTVQELKAALRHGEFAWPGGYPLYFITSDGAALSFASVLKNIEHVIDSVKNKSRDGWRVVAVDVNWESELYDDDSGERIPSAYGNDKESSE